ncbi:MAG: hypothetical protein M2R45_01107 [Verrucomicrobia subdivision 3 bacterium]|nr:hypothetical protein [Limisphaerales bacterium]MCS1414218.1 hypothetical protein [Limisphaerales bacterium]
METGSFNFWILLWKGVFILTIWIFTGMAVWVTIGGFRDIKRLFARLKESDQSIDPSD